LSKYRKRLQIIADILCIADKRPKKTQIMFQANLSYKLLHQYLEEVMNAGLVCHEKGNCYRLTEKGKGFLEKYQKYAKLHSQLERQFDRVKDEKEFLEQMLLVPKNLNSLRTPIRY